MHSSCSISATLSTRPSAIALQRMFSSAVMLGYSPGFSTSVPMRTASLRGAFCEALPEEPAAKRSNRRTSPAVGRIIPQIIFIVVDFPAPFRPTKP